MSPPQDRTVTLPRATSSFDPTSVTTVLKDNEGRIAISALTRNTSATADDANQALKNTDSLFHVVFIISHLTHDVFSEIEKIRVCGTYTSLKEAKAAAHRSLFDAGYEMEWFPDFLAQTSEIKQHGIGDSEGLIVYAKASDGTEYRVSIFTSPNDRHFQGDEHGKVHNQLYHVLQTTVYYSRDETGEARETEIKGSFDSYEQARQFSDDLLLRDGDGLKKQTYAQYDEPKVEEGDCGFGESVVVHAVGNNGDNFLVRVLAEEELEAVRIAEAASRMS